VASILANTGEDDVVVAAGALHDVLEKTETKAAELREAVGEEVTALVVAVTEDSAIGDYAARKREVRERAAAAGLRVERVLGGRLWHFTRLAPA
jgi:(p)ppGpp synthase/HD superfamily hydrolase